MVNEPLSTGLVSQQRSVAVAFKKYVHRSTILKCKDKMYQDDFSVQPPLPCPDSIALSLTGPCRCTLKEASAAQQGRVLNASLIDT